MAPIGDGAYLLALNHSLSLMLTTGTTRGPSQLLVCLFCNHHGLLYTLLIAHPIWYLTLLASSSIPTSCILAAPPHRRHQHYPSSTISPRSATTHATTSPIQSMIASRTVPSPQNMLQRSDSDVAQVTTGSDVPLTQHDSSFRKHLPNLQAPRFKSMQKKRDAHEYAEEFKREGQPPWLHALYLHWMELFKEPFRGITNDGQFSSPRLSSHLISFHLVSSHLISSCPVPSYLLAG